MTRIGVTGFRGKIGSRLIALGGVPIDCDVTQFQETMETIERVNPDVIVHCAGISDIDECERMDFRDVFRTNVWGTEYANSTKRPFLLLSTDHIFDGRKGRYAENTPIRELNGLSQYALSKIGAEAAVQAKGRGKILRLSSTFGPELTQCQLNSVPTFLQRSYAYIDHIAYAIMWAANSYISLPDILNIAGTDLLSRYELMLMAAEVFGWDKQKITPRTQPDKKYVKRPFKAGLNVSKAGRLGVPLYSAYEGLMQLKEDMA